MPRHPAPSSEPDEPRGPSAVDDILRQHIPDWRATPAHCRHRCTCDCHTSSARHVMACCTGCGYGHTRIDRVYLYAHLKACHGIEKP